MLTPAKDGMKGSIARAEELAATTPNAWIPQQFDNPANPDVHERTTGPEIWEDTGGKVDIFVAGVGTGGTITGDYPLSPHEEARDSRHRRRADGFAGDFRRQAGAAQDPGHRRRLHPQESRHESAERRRDGDQRRGVHLGPPHGQEEGILVGISSGGNVAAAVRLAALPENRNKVIVTIIPSFGERYLSTPLFEGLTQ